MNYSQIIKRSWEILKTNKFLWGLGILAGLISGGGGVPSFNMPSGFQGTRPTPATIQTMPTASPVSENPVISMANVGNEFGKSVAMPVVLLIGITETIARTPLMSAIIGIIIFFIIIIILYFSTSARAGLIIAVDKIETTGEKMGFKKALNEGKKYFWRVFGVGLLYLAYVLIFMAICAVLVGLGILLNSTITTVILVLVGLILFLAFFVSCLYLGLLYLFVAQIIVLENLKPIEALKKAHLLVKSQWRDMIISWVIMIGIGFAMGLVVILGVLIIGAILTLIGFGFYWLGGTAVTVIYVIIFAIFLFVAMLIVRGFITAYMSIFMTLTYRALRYLQAQKTVLINN